MVLISLVLILLFSFLFHSQKLFIDYLATRYFIFDTVSPVLQNVAGKFGIGVMAVKAAVRRAATKTGLKI
jgi:hypothetical protein